MWRISGRHEENLMQSKTIRRNSSYFEVSVVNRIKRAPEEADPIVRVRLGNG